MPTLLELVHIEKEEDLEPNMYLWMSASRGHYMTESSSQQQAFFTSHVSTSPFPAGISLPKNVDIQKNGIPYQWLVFGFASPDDL